MALKPTIKEILQRTSCTQLTIHTIVTNAVLVLHCQQFHNTTLITQSVGRGEGMDESCVGVLDSHNQRLTLDYVMDLRLATATLSHAANALFCS